MQNQKYFIPVITLIVGGVAGYGYHGFEAGSTLTVNTEETLSSLEVSGAVDKQTSDISSSATGPFSAIEAMPDSERAVTLPPRELSISEPVIQKQAIAKQEDVQGIISQIDEYLRHSSVSADIEKLAETENQLLAQIDQKPELIRPLLVTYAQQQEGENKDFLRSMLSASGSYDVELAALENLSVGNAVEQKQWLDLLASTGVNTDRSRQELFSTMNNLSDSEMLATALYAFVPDSVSLEQRQAVLDQLQPYVGSSDELVRSAGIETMSRWANKNDSFFIEAALIDESPHVKRSAVFSAFSSGIQSDTIKNELLKILNDMTQAYALRINAFQALQSYSLADEEYRLLHEFQMSVEALEEVVGVAKG